MLFDLIAVSLSSCAAAERTAAQGEAGAASEAQAAHAHLIDVAQAGRPDAVPLLGLGAISGGGATSRLLVSYPAKQRDEILDWQVNACN